MSSFKHANEHLALLWSRNSQAVKRTHVYTVHLLCGSGLSNKRDTLKGSPRAELQLGITCPVPKRVLWRLKLLWVQYTSLVYYHTHVQPANLLVSRLENQESSQDRRSYQMPLWEGWLCMAAQRCNVCGSWRCVLDNQTYEGACSEPSSGKPRIDIDRSAACPWTSVAAWPPVSR